MVELFLHYLKRRGIRGSQLFITDKCLGLVEALAEHFPDAGWQRCMVHSYRNLFTHVPRGPKVRKVAAMLKAIHASEDLASAREKGESALMLVAARLRHVSGTKWGTRKYLDMEHLKQSHSETVAN